MQRLSSVFDVDIQLKLSGATQRQLMSVCKRAASMTNMSAAAASEQTDNDVL